MFKYMLIFIFIQQFEISLAWRGYTLLSKDITVDFINPEYVSAINLTNKQHGSKVAVTVNVTLLKEIKQFLNLHVSTYELKNDEYVQNFVNTTLNVCDYYKKPSSYPLVNIMYPIFLKNGNFPKKCPVKKGIYASTMPDFDSERLPPYMPGEDWRVNILVSDDTNLIVRIYWFLKLDHSRAVNKFKTMNRGG